MTFATHQTTASAYHLCVPYKMLTYLDVFKIYCGLLLPLCEKKQNRLYFLLLLLIFQFCTLRASTFGGVLLSHLLVTNLSHGVIFLIIFQVRHRSAQPAQQ